MGWNFSVAHNSAIVYALINIVTLIVLALP